MAEHSESYVPPSAAALTLHALSRTDEAMDWMQSRGVVNPERFTTMLSPAASAAGRPS